MFELDKAAGCWGGFHLQSDKIKRISCIFLVADEGLEIASVSGWIAMCC